MGFRWFNSGLGIAERLKKATNSKKALMLLLFFIFVCLPVIGYVANVAIDAQTKTTELATDDVFPIYDTSNTGGRGIYMSDLAEDIADDVAANIAEGELANSIVISADIKDGTIDSADYANLSIDAAHLAADVIDETKIADNGIDSEHYNDGSIDADHLAADIIDETKLADDSIDSEHYNDGSIDAAHLAADVIDETKIADNGIDSEHYNDGSIDPEHIALNEGQVLVGQATTNVAGAQATLPNLAVGCSTTTLSADNTMSANKLMSEVNAGENINQYVLVYMKSDGKLWKADGDQAAGPLGPAVGITTAACTTDNECIVLESGCIRDDAWDTTPNIDEGEDIFLDDTLGVLTNVANATTGDIHQKIGYAVAASGIINFNFAHPYHIVD